MEDKINVEMSISGGTPTSSRWNPTKEQISMLEGWFRQGIRTPSAEQIQHITSRLKAYGHIQDKNVFYWFQNHKARERQKEKQDRVASINRSLHKADPVFFAHHTPPCGNVVCDSFYLQQSSVNLRVILPKGVKRRPRTVRTEKTKQVGDVAECKTAHHKHAGGLSEEIINCINNTNQKTLVLFPLHPTGFLEERTAEPFPSNSTERFTPSYPSEANHLQDWFKFY